MFDNQKDINLWPFFVQACDIEWESAFWNRPTSSVRKPNLHRKSLIFSLVSNAFRETGECWKSICEYLLFRSLFVIFIVLECKVMRNRLFSVLLIGAVTIKNSRLYRYIYIKNGIYFIILQHRISIEIWPQKKEFISEVSSESFSTVVCCSSSSRLLTSSISLPGKSFYPSEAFLPACS